ncbi:MAG: hypothetical protein HYX48_05595 [Chlamydiales bacterium]|nr:hypothetical protein [Chlamydiales bacterium]
MFGKFKKTAKKLIGRTAAPKKAEPKKAAPKAKPAAAPKEEAPPTFERVKPFAPGRIMTAEGWRRLMLKKQK